MRQGTLALDDPRTYGVYRLEDGVWHLALQPAVAIRVKRILGRVQASRTGVLKVTNTPEVARDIEWIIDRWNLKPDRPADALDLAVGAETHRHKERAVHSIVHRGHRDALPLTPAKTPRDYQLAAVTLLRATKRLLLTDEVGLGKTLTGLLNAAHEDGLPMLVVPPAHLPRRWATELSEAFPWLEFQIAKKGTPPEDWQPSDMPDVLIVPYSKIAGWAPHLQGNVSTVVFDEVQDLRRGTETAKGRAAAQITQDAAYVIGLTATLVHNYGGEAWNIIDIMAPGVLGSKTEFTREWGTAYANGQVHVSDPRALGQYLRDQGLMLGRTRKQVGRELPATMRIPHIVDTDAKALDEIKGDAMAMAKLILAEDTNSKDRFQAAGDFDWKLRQVTGIAKAPYVAEFCRLILETEQKIVLFGWHRAVYELWLEALARYRPVMYTGTESPAQKAAAEDAFINGDARVLIMSLRSGAGVDGLQRVSKTCVFGELDWSPAVHHQAIGRLERDGMDEPVMAYFLHAEDGSDPALMEVLQVKRQQSEPMLNPDGKLRPTVAPDQSRIRTLASAYLDTLKGK